MANESVRITNGSVAMLSKVLKEVQEVQSREVEISQEETLKFHVGYVSLLKGRFANLSDQRPGDELKKKQPSTGRVFAPDHNGTIPKHDASVNDNVSQQEAPIFSSTPNTVVREVPQQPNNTFHTMPSNVQSSQIQNASPLSNQSTGEASHIPGQTVTRKELSSNSKFYSRTVVPDSVVVPAKSTVSKDSEEGEEERKASLQNLKLLFENLVVKKETNNQTTAVAGSTQEGNLTFGDRQSKVRNLLANFSSNYYSMTNGTMRVEKSRLAFSNNTANTYSLNGREPLRTGLRTNLPDRSLQQSHSSDVANASGIGRFSNQITPTSAKSAVLNEELHNLNRADENRYSSDYAQTQFSEPNSHRVGQAESGDQSRNKLDAQKQIVSKAASETRKFEQGKRVNIATDALVRIRSAGASWFFGANVKAAEVPAGCILFQVGLHQTEAAASSESKTRFQRLFGLLASGTGARQSAGSGDRPVASSTTRSATSNQNSKLNAATNANVVLNSSALAQTHDRSNPQGSTHLTALTTNQIKTLTPVVTKTTPKSAAAAQLTLQLTDDSRSQLKPAKSVPDANANTSTRTEPAHRLNDVDATPNNAPPSYVDLAQSFNLKQSNANDARTSSAPQSNANVAMNTSDGPHSAYALFSVLRPQTNKNREDDDDDFASSSNEERERKLRAAAERIQVAGANVHLGKSAFLSDARRKASVDFSSTMADREKDTLTVSEEASALAADRNRRISFNDAAIAVTHEYPREESWNEDTDENEPDAQAADNVDADSSDDVAEVEQNQNQNQNDEEEEEDDDGVTKSRLYALFALNSQDSHSTRSQLPTYDSVQQDHVDKSAHTRADGDETDLQSDGDSLTSNTHNPTSPAASEQNDVMTRTIDITNSTRSNGAEVAEILYSDPL